MLDAAYRVWIECYEDKRRCLWLHGEASTGKSTWVDMFESIFVSSYLKLGTEKFQETDNKPRTQLVTMNDVAPTRITCIELASEMKNLLEGRGMSVNTKMGRKKLTFVGCYSLIASNNLPSKKIIKKERMEDACGNEKVDEWEPFERRCEFVKLNVPYNQRDKAKFTKIDVCRYWMSKC